MTSPHNTNQGRKTPSEQVHFIIDKSRMGWPVGKITDALAVKFGEAARGTRTVQTITSRLNANQIQWDRQASSTEEVKVIMSVLPEVLRVSKGQKQEFTQDEANWVAWVGRACPTLPLYYVWVIACLYMAETRLTKQFAPLDAFLAFKPWESMEAMRTYHDGCDEGLIAASRVIVEMANTARDAVLDEKGKRDIRELSSLNAELIHELKTPGIYPIDKDHALLDIVYTNPEGVPDDTKMDQSSMDDLVNWAYAQESGQAELEKMLQQEDEISGDDTN
jgi:hypothetical protein